MGNVERLMIVRKTYNCIEGETTVFGSELAFVTLLRVERADKVMKIIASEDDLALGDLEIRHSKSFGTIYVKEQVPFNNGEKIKVVYEN